MKFKIDRRLKISIHEQIKLFLIKEITQGHFIYDSNLPSMKSLVALFQSDEKLIDSVLVTLEKEGYLRKQDHNWIVSYGNISHVWLSEFISIAKMIEMMGYTPTIKTLEITKSEAPLLKSFPEPDALRVKRIYYGNQKPLFYVQTYFPYSRFKDFDVELRKEVAYYPLLQEKYNIQMHQFKREMRAVNFDFEVSTLLNIKNKSIGMYTQSQLYDQNKQLVEYTQIYNLMEELHFILEY